MTKLLLILGVLAIFIGESLCRSPVNNDPPDQIKIIRKARQVEPSHGDPIIGSPNTRVGRSVDTGIPQSEFGGNVPKAINSTSIHYY
uniref:Uncharacterized protein n=1 Tax=Papilio polytes TaxID=76194 RepID=I4DMQ7_PAPPL|nr:unknown secreted protein [Papilio polytes]